MRFTVELTLKGDPPYLIEADYRKCITLLIREAFKAIEGGDNYYFKYWGALTENKAKPFTFSLFIPNPHTITYENTRYFEIYNDTMTLHITSLDQEFLIMLYKGLLAINKRYSPFRNSMEFSNIYIRKDDYITSDFARFKIMSPIVVRDILVIGYNKRFRGYLLVDDENYCDALSHSIKNLGKRFLPKDAKKIKKSDIEIDISDCYGVRVCHYSEVIPAVKGVIGIKANKEILKLIYDAGIGARRSQGFGMVEIYKDACDNAFRRNFAAHSA